MRRFGTAVAAVSLVLGLGGACSPAAVEPEPATDSGPTGSAAPSPSAGDETASEPTFDATRPAQDAAELARRVRRAEDAVRRRGTPAAAVADAGFELQVLYRQLGRNPAWHDRVLDAVPRRYRATVGSHLKARSELRAMHSTLSDTLPAWRIVEPAPAAELRSYYEQGEATYGVPWEILAAINLVETGMGRIRGTSTAGAQGPMQFIPSTWAAFGEGDVNDPHDAIMAAARYLAHNGGGTGRIDNALRRYNNSAHYVAAVKAWASVIAADPRAYRGFYHWRVIYLSDMGDVWLPVGYERSQPIPVRRYLRNNPDHLLSRATN